MLKKAVLPVAGLGTRLLPMTKEMPKEMLPIFLDSVNSEPCLKPVIQAIYEQLYDIGFREFVFIVGRGKRVIEDHFTPDKELLKELKRRNRINLAKELENFYRRVDNSTIVSINQPVPKGFGDAVLRAGSFINEVFLVHAGDTYLASKNYNHVRDLIEKHEQIKADATILIKEVSNPQIYGVIEGKEIEKDVYRIEKAVEKPEEPQNNLAIMPVYIFNPMIFRALRAIHIGKGGEFQLTDGIQKLIDWNLKVYAVKISNDGVILDIGNPNSCWEAFNISYKSLERTGK